MASQSIKPPAGQGPKAQGPDQPKRGIKNPVIYIGTVVLLVIVVIAFVFVPAGGGALGSSNSGNLEFGRYAGKAVAYAQKGYFAEQVKSLNDNLRQSGLPAENYQFYAYQVWHGAYERTVVRMAILDAVEKAGGFATEAKIDEQITELPAYQENGKFSLQRYRSAPLGEKLALRKSIREDLLTQMYYSDAILGRTPSSKETAFVKEMAKDTRTIEYVAFPLADYPDSEVAAYVKANPAPFKRLALSRITLGENESEALSLRKKIADKTAVFEDAAKASSKDSYAEKGGVMGALPLHELLSLLATKEDAEKLAALPPGELSPVLKTAAGSYAFFRADAAPADADPADAAVLADAREYLLSNERGKIEDFVAAKAKEFASAAAPDFAKAAKAAGLPVKSAGPFPINYGDFSIYVSEYRQYIPVFAPVAGEAAPELAAASTSDRFFEAAFSTAPGSVAEPLVLGDNVLVLRVKEASSLGAESNGAEIFYPYFVRSKAETEAREAFLKSPLFKDNFSAVYLKNFMPKEKAD
ncbi:MAG TPA: SurA N-terminal domain-containing protein [Spirochaetales bacterium]|nr:SurA N-terminal domain-containing protein [Spirochaetales bacterium]